MAKKINKNSTANKQSTSKESDKSQKPTVTPPKPTLSPKEKYEKKAEEPIAKYMVAIALFFISLILIIACLSYYFTWQEDQSLSTWSSFGDKIPNEAVNVCGRMGAIISSIFISDLFGIFGIMMPLILTLIAAYIFAVKRDFFTKSLISILSIATIGAVSACYFFPSYNGIFGSTLGGTAGYAVHQWLKDTLGDMGELVTLIMLSSIVIVYVSKNFIKVLFKTIFTIEGVFKHLYNKFGNVASQPAQKPRNTSSVPITNEMLDNNHQYATQNRTVLGTLNDLYKENENETTNQNTENYQSQFLNDELSDKNDPVYFEENNTASTNEEFIDNYQDEYQDNIQDEYSDDYQDNYQDDIQDKYSEQIDEFNRSIGVLENEDSFKIEPTIIESGNSVFSASETSESITSNNQTPLVYGSEDMVVLNPDIFGNETEKMANTESPEFEIYTKEQKLATTSSQTIPAEDQIFFEETESISEKNDDSIELDNRFNIKRAHTEEDSFIIERTADRDTFEPKLKTEDIFEVSVTDNANLEVEDESELQLIKINTSEYFDDEDIDTSVYDPTLSLSRYKLPTIDLMDNHTKKVNVTNEELFENKNKIIETLENFNIKIDKIKATIGPTVTLYEIVPAAGVRISKIKNLEDDIALSLSALGIRIIAPIPGKGTIGIEVPNKDKEVVSMYSVIKSVKFQESDAELPIVLGRTIQNEDYVIDLAKTPHMLVAGATGQGKSVGLNAIITSLLYKKHPSELKFVFVDPKKVELTLYSMLERHFLAKLPGEDEAIITDTQKVVYTLNSMCSLMDSRYDTLKSAKVRNIKEYNTKFTSRQLNPNKGHDFMPYFVVVIDEFADLIMTAGREVETPIARLAQLGRATGIHLVIATQRPTTNIITGVIKANFPTRVAFRVSSMIDSRTILDQPGANQLIGRGDMLISNGNDITRVQCAFIDTPEVERICEFIGKQTGYGEAYELPEYIEPIQEKDSERATTTLKKDGLFDEVARYVVTAQQGSASTIQRNFSIGFNRAGRIMDQLEKAGIVGRQEGSKPRQVLIHDISSLEVMLYDMENASARF